MRTSNPFVQVFNTLSGATSAYVNTPPGQWAGLLTLKNPTGSKDFFVDTTPTTEERLRSQWPKMYVLLREKGPETDAHVKDGASPDKVRIIVEVNGGLVTAVYANIATGIDVDVLDYDNMKAAEYEEAQEYKKLENETKTLKAIW
jgi:hypothetical protein